MSLSDTWKAPIDLLEQELWTVEDGLYIISGWVQVPEYYQKDITEGLSERLADAAIEEAIETGGNNVEYTVLTPLGYIAVDQFIAEKIDAEKARQIHKLLNDIAAYNVENNEAMAIWEAQYGDFSNMAQAIFDVFMSSAHSKWGERTALTLLLPHAQE